MEKHAAVALPVTRCSCGQAARVLLGDQPLCGECALNRKISGVKEAAAPLPIRTLKDQQKQSR